MSISLLALPHFRTCQVPAPLVGVRATRYAQPAEANYARIACSDHEPGTNTEVDESGRPHGLTRRASAKNEYQITIGIKTERVLLSMSNQAVQTLAMSSVSPTSSARRIKWGVRSAYCANGKTVRRAILTGVELVETVERREGGRTERPGGERTGDGELSLVEVVSEDAVEANVRVHNERERKRAVEDGRRAVLGESCRNKRDQRDREPTLKRPVVRAVSSVGLGERGRVVDGALDVGCTCEKGNADQQSVN